MWWDQGLNDQIHHDRIGISCVANVLDGDEALNMDESRKSCVQ